jgi:hypothetical protein
LPCALGSQIFFRSATVMHSRKVFLGLTATVRASKAIGSSKKSMPACLHASISSLRIGREPLEMSVSPRQNFLKPPPVPEMPTVTRTWPFLAFWNSSARASAIGKTVLDPSMAMVLVWAMADEAKSAPSAATLAKNRNVMELSW